MDKEIKMANAQTAHGLTLVIGGTGKTGRRVADRLRAMDRPVRIGSRAANPSFDWENSATWAAALSGVHAAYVTFQPDLAVPRALDIVQRFIAQALDSGVKKIVLLSGRGEVECEHAEQALRDSGADWTILRASWFAQNFSEGHFLESVLAGELALPVGSVQEPFVDVEDIADIAVAALTQPGHSGQLYELTGPRALSFAEAIGEIARITGRNIRSVTVPPAAYRAALEEARLPAETINLILYLFTTVLDGRNTPLTDGVWRALRREPRDFSDYVARTAATGVWSVC
jgi:uncharacterized protein YbjT (DUF2867 family)